MSNYESFWDLGRYAVVGHSEKKPFPMLSYRALKQAGKTVFAVDPSASTIDGDPACADLASLPEEVDGVILEVPREETASWVEQAHERQIEHLWIHMGRDTPEALGLARKHGINVRSGTCAVMYLQGGFHSVHKWINKAIGKY